MAAVQANGLANLSSCREIMTQKAAAKMTKEFIRAKKGAEAFGVAKAICRHEPHEHSTLRLDQEERSRAKQTIAEKGAAGGKKKRESKHSCKNCKQRI